jgi:hypothetical protein
MVRQAIVVATAQHSRRWFPFILLSWLSPSLHFRPLRFDKGFSIGGGAQVLQNDIDLGSESLSVVAYEHRSVAVSDCASGPVTLI